jgi:hypothetical protein
MYLEILIFLLAQQLGSIARHAQFFPDSLDPVQH